MKTVKQVMSTTIVVTLALVIAPTAAISQEKIPEPTKTPQPIPSCAVSDDIMISSSIFKKPTVKLSDKLDEDGLVVVIGLLHDDGLPNTGEDPFGTHDYLAATIWQSAGPFHGYPEFFYLYSNGYHYKGLQGDISSCLSEFNDTIIVLGEDDANFTATSPNAWWELRGVPYNGRSIRLDGGSGEDVLVGGDGTDVFWGGDGDDRLLGKKGNDYIHGGLDIDLMMGGSGNDVITGCGNATCSVMDKEDADHADGGSGTDRLWLGEYSTAMCGSGYDYFTKGAYFKHGCEATAAAPPLVPKTIKNIAVKQ